MSGIVGILNLDGRPGDRHELIQMLSKIEHRGPDRSNIWNIGSVGFAHCMLQTTPESIHENLPFTSPSGCLTITADARLDNREDLVQELGLNRPLLEITDSELILFCYEKWGENCTPKLLGDFVFAIWDHPKSLLFCGRDHFGVKPFYYHHSSKLFAFASEIKALLALDGVPRRLNEGRIADFLVPHLEGIDKVSTAFQQIFRLEPAHNLVVRSERQEQRRYWSLDCNKEIRYQNPDDYKAAFLEIFSKSIESRLRVISSPACTLSGGVDSSSIVAIAANLCKNKNLQLHTFSAVSRAEADPETHFINKVLQLEGLQPTKISTAEIHTFSDDLEQAFHKSEDPFDTWMTLLEVLYIAASNQKIRVVLDGIDGDATASISEDYVSYLLRHGFWRSAILETFGNTYSLNDSRLPLFYRSFRRAFAPAWSRTLKSRLSGKDRLQEEIKDSIIQHDFARRVDLLERLSTLRAHKPPPLLKNLREAHANDLNHPYMPAALERYDRVASAHSIEPRHPFFDKRLVEYCLAIPWQQKSERGWTKLILRKAMKGIFPDEIRFRRGSDHLGAQFTMARMKLQEPLMHKFIFQDLGQIAEYVNVDAVRLSYDRFKTNPLPGDDEKIWTALTLLLWLKNNCFIMAGH